MLVQDSIPGLFEGEARAVSGTVSALNRQIREFFESSSPPLPCISPFFSLTSFSQDTFTDVKL